MENLEKKFNKIIDIDSFLPTSVHHPNILEALYMDTVTITDNNEEGLNKLETVDYYKSTRYTEDELKEIRKKNEKLFAIEMDKKTEELN